MDATFFRQLREQFPALSRQVGAHPAAYFDGPAGTQVPRRVIDAVSNYFSRHNANHGGHFATSRESDAMLDSAHRAVADLLGVGDAETVVFGPNMTTLTLALSRALSKTWRPGDEIILTRLDHDANFTPWALAARDAGATVRVVDIDTRDCTLDLRHFEQLLSARTRFVAVGCASNATGTVNPVAPIIELAHRRGAHVFLDAVHFAPHALLRVQDWNCDYLACSAYKFFGPHIGILWGRRELLEELPAYKVRPAPDTLPGKWMTGTQNHECIAGVVAAIDYLVDLGRAAGCTQPNHRRLCLERAFAAIESYERSLARQFLDGLDGVSAIQIHGITDRDRLEQRLPTFSLSHRHRSASQWAEQLGDQGLFAWHGNYYALNLSEALGKEPDGMLRIGFVHYNTPEEVDRLVAALRDD
ncbi:MAG: cysteine desulfurase-like protein [Planctomycetes bacterium]|nr:cysteine desulfurase-like protein [Planctomycetota bacterium]